MVEQKLIIDKKEKPHENWFGHVRRMHENRLVERVLEAGWIRRKRRRITKIGSKRGNTVVSIQNKGNKTYLPGAHKELRRIEEFLWRATTFLTY